jgi:hypothetical protein
MGKMINWEKLQKSEILLFWAMVIIGTLPLFFTKYYVTLDGPSHLYNGTLIKELLLARYPEYGNLFSFNPLWVPNWLGHFLFALLSLVFPDFLTEKIVIIAYLILTPYFFRKVCLHFSPENKFLSYLMIPFAHNHLFYLGFFNFCMAITLFLATVSYVLTIQGNFRKKYMVGLVFLLLLVYFSHVMILIITIGVLLLLPLNLLTIERKEKYFLIRNSTIFWKSMRNIAISAIPAILLLLNYILKIDSLEEAPRMDLKPLLKMIVDVVPLITLSYSTPWITYNRILFAFFVILIFGNILYTVKGNTGKSGEGFTFIYPKPHFSWIWLAITFIFTILFLIVSNANMLPDRLLLVVYVFFLLGIGILKYPRILRISSIFFILFIQIIYVRLYVNEMKNLSNNVVKMKETTEHIEPGSLLLTFNYSDNWLDEHTSGYFGSGKSIVVLENYEANLPWFPLIWNMKGPYQLDQLNGWGVQNRKIVANYYRNPQYPDIFSLPGKDGNIKEIPYAVIYGKMPDDSEEFFKVIKPILNKSYRLVFENDLCHLYHLEKRSN